MATKMPLLVTSSINNLILTHSQEVQNCTSSENLRDARPRSHSSLPIELIFIDLNLSYLKGTNHVMLLMYLF